MALFLKKNLIESRKRRQVGGIPDSLCFVEYYLLPRANEKSKRATGTSTYISIGRAYKSGRSVKM
jgi:hypothetical protein